MAKSKSKAAKKKALARRRRSGFKAFVICLLVMCALAGAARLFVFETYTVTTNAMSPAYVAGDTVIIDKLSLWQSFDVQKGDLVLARFAASGTSYIRRVAGTAGDYIEIREDGAYLNDELIGAAEGLVTGHIPQGAYLLLSDDGESADSRSLGLVYQSEITGSAGKIIWPFSRLFK